MNTVVNTMESSIESLNFDMSSEINQGLDLNNTFLVRFSEDPAENIIHDMLSIPATPLEHNQLIEQWLGVDVSHATRIDDWQYYSNDQYLITSVPTSLLDDTQVDRATETAYSLLFEKLSEWGYPHLLRTWNYFPEITDGHSALNNYQQFCSGRARAYENAVLKPTTYPAATVIGTSQPGLHVYFIASKNSGVGIENSEQVSAFHYPPIYSQDPPLFSRAVLHRNRQQEILFISGTASITGHSTQYADDVNRQMEVCINNIENLLSTAIAEHQFLPTTLQDCAHIKVYLRHGEHLDTIRTHLRLYLGPTVPVYYLHGDLCRSDLLVEIEALIFNDLL